MDAGADYGRALGPQEGDDEVFRLPGWLRWGLACFALFVAAAMAFAIFEPIQVLPRLRLAPGYSLMAQDGTRATSETARGAVTLYTFATTDCGQECDSIYQTMTQVGDRVERDVDLAGAEFRMVTVALDPVASADELLVASEQSGADGKTWQWLGGDEATIDTVVRSGFRRSVERSEDGSIRSDPGFVLVDGVGVVRGDYRYQTLAADADKIVSHIEILGEELRYAGGAGAVAYEAAHLFLCYP